MPPVIARIEWQRATVEHVTVETPRVKTFTMRLPDWQPFRAGQHFDVRLTASDGYQAQRSYSIASPPERVGVIDLTIALLDDGEVSPFFHQVVIPGDEIELRGPIGGPFTWSVSDGGPLLLIAGGSGIVPIMSMIRHRRKAASTTPAALLYSSRTFADVIYRAELDEIAATDQTFDLHHTLTRGRPAAWPGLTGRIDDGMIAKAAEPLGEIARAYICGPDAFVETAANLTVDLGVPPQNIRLERFGPTGK